MRVMPHVRRNLGSRVPRALAFGISVGIALTSCKVSASPGEPPAGANKASNGGAMSSPFKAALQRFTGDVASVHGKRAADLKVVPPSEDVVGFDDQNTGDLIAFEATSGDLRVRGFANKTAAVLVKRGELGPLFQAAHALDAAKSLPAQDLAARLVWMMGPDYRLVAQVADYPKYPVPPQIAPPSIERKAGGAVLHFYYVQLDTHMGAPATAWSAEVKCSPAYKAALVTSPGP
jgi:hypothetical protein